MLCSLHQETRNALRCLHSISQYLQHHTSYSWNFFAWHAWSAWRLGIFVAWYIANAGRMLFFLLFHQAPFYLLLIFFSNNFELSRIPRCSLPLQKAGLFGHSSVYFIYLFPYVVQPHCHLITIITASVDWRPAKRLNFLLSRRHSWEECPSNKVPSLWAKLSLEIFDKSHPILKSISKRKILLYLWETVARKVWLRNTTFMVNDCC